MKRRQTGQRSRFAHQSLIRDPLNGEAFGLLTVGGEEDQMLIGGIKCDFHTQSSFKHLFIFPMALGILLISSQKETLAAFIIAALLANGCQWNSLSICSQGPKFKITTVVRTKIT